MEMDLDFLPATMGLLELEKGAHAYDTGPKSLVKVR